MKNTKDRRLFWDGCYNVRELGDFATQNNQTTRQKAFIRADNLVRLTQNGRDALVNYGVGTIIDLRSDYELVMAPSPFATKDVYLQGPNYVHAPLLDDADTEGVEKLEKMTSLPEMYLWMVERFGGGIGRIFNELAKATGNGPILFHCHSGRDRTGLVGAFLLILAEVDIETVADDYAISNVYIQPTYTKQLTKQPEIILNLIEYLNNQHSGVAEYLNKVGVSDEEIIVLTKYILGD